MPERLPAEGRARAVIDAVRPSVDGGRYAVKRIQGDAVRIEADCFTDGHDAVRAVLRWRAERVREWTEVEMRPLGNDRWEAAFVPAEPGRYVYGVAAWVDHFASWRDELVRREDPADIVLAVRLGASLIEATAARAPAAERKTLSGWVARLEAGKDAEALKRLALDTDPCTLAARFPDRSLQTLWPVEMPLVVDRERGRYSTWYELFPRSASPEPGRHGTLAEVEARLDYVAELGFDVLYLPPIHPIGRQKRKGRNNALEAQPGDVGSPWAIGSAEGGHKSIHPELGTHEDFRRLVRGARERGIEIALDIAFQCAPDHPYVKQHPKWFRWRPDGTVQYAENPPKKYQDIYPFNFESEDWRGLWKELKSVIDFWIGEDVRIFRVDNPHTKAFAFWEWAIAEIKREHPDVLLLAEAFTRPKVMHRLAKLGFSQSYTYFAWRNTRHELIEYFTDLAHGPGREYFRPNVWPNTPDILTEALQFGGRAMTMSRLVLAATLAASYGIYGPPFELVVTTAREPGSEEYLDSEKYQLRHWDLEDPASLRHFIARVNAIRRENRALQSDERLRFFPSDNEQIVCYCKVSDDGANQIVVAVNLDPHNVHSAWVDIDTEALGIDAGTQYQMHELLTGARYLWQGSRNFVRLDPGSAPAQIFRVRRRIRHEQDFDYFL